MNIFGKPLILNTKDVLKTVNTKLKIAEVENEKKFVNETGDSIKYLKILNEPVEDLDVVNLKYVKNLFNELDAEYKKKFEELDAKYKKKIEELDAKYEIFKNGVEFLVKDLKSKIEKIKGDVSRHIVNELNILKSQIEEFKQIIKKSDTIIQTEDIKKLKTEFEIYKKMKTEFEIYKKQFNILDRNITIWYEKVEKRLQDKSKIIVHKKA